jgi:predicted membrane protein
MTLLIIAALIFFIANDHLSRAASSREVSDPNFSANAFLSGVEQEIRTSEFRRGDVGVFLGGAGLDLSRAEMAGDEAKVEVSVMMGGVEIRVPQDWTVDNRLSAVLGGVKNQTRATSGGKRLVIEGTVVMGGVEIKN